MKSIFWNVRGLANSPTRLALKRLIKVYKPEFCFIAEPWLKFSDFPINWFTRLNFKVFAINNRHSKLPNLWCLCLNNLDPVVLHNDDQQISFSYNDNGKDLGVSVIYASTDYIKRRHLWHSLSVVHNSFNLPWACIGDFNVIAGSHEYRGALSPAKLPMEEFLA
jgi:hypothetical protein